MAWRGCASRLHSTTFCCLIRQRCRIISSDPGEFRPSVGLREFSGYVGSNVLSVTGSGVGAVEHDTVPSVAIVLDHRPHADIAQGKENAQGTYVIWFTSIATYMRPSVGICVLFFCSAAAAFVEFP